MKKELCDATSHDPLDKLLVAAWNVLQVDGVPHAMAREMKSLRQAYDDYRAVPSETAAPILAPKDANGKRPRLFYYEEAEGCWCPADGYELAVANIIDTDSFMSDGAVIAIEFKRQDMTDEEHAAIEEG